MNRFAESLSKVGLNAFFLSLVATVFLAWLFPEAGSEDSIFPLAAITKYGVSVIFFFYGLQLNREKLVAGLGNWKLHVVIQLTTFLLFPLIALFVLFFMPVEQGVLALGFYYLTVLPSTVSSSVVMVSIAGGNIPAAIFNASISSIIGIFITPLWMSLHSVSASNSIHDLGDVIIKLCFQVFLPVVVGFVLNTSKAGEMAQRYRSSLRYIDQLIILLIVFTAFSESFLGNMFDSFSISEILVLALLMILFFLLMAGIMYVISIALRFSWEDRITVVFCGSKKSLVQGAVMGRVLFPDPVMLGVILLPLMLYHALQLMAGSILAQQFKKRSE